MKEQKTLSEEEKALMEIALNNKNNTKNDGKIVEHERHDNPITFGLSVTKSLENKWGGDDRFAVFALEIQLYIRRRRLLHQAESKGSLLRTAFARIIQMA